MLESPAKEFAIWLLNERREKWSLLILVIGIGSGMFVIQQLIARHVREGYFWLDMGGWTVGSMLLYRQFAKWSSDPATAVVSAQGLAVHCIATGYSLVITYDAVTGCTYSTVKDVAWLRINYPNGTKFFLRTIYGQKTFGKMATSCEQGFKAYWLAVRLSQPRPRR